MSKSSEELSRRLQAGELGNLLDINSLFLRREVPVMGAFTLFHASQIDSIPGKRPETWGIATKAT